jgi:hypothetical protein
MTPGPHLTKCEIIKDAVVARSIPPEFILEETHSAHEHRRERHVLAPVIGAQKFDLAVNLKTAKGMSLTIPETFLLRADGDFRS